MQMHHGESISIKSSSLNGTINDFLSRLAKARSRVLMLDYDGTLAPFTSDPAQAFPYPEITDTLHRIQRETDTRLVIVTGRHASEIPRLLGMSGIEVWGCHGLERLSIDGLNEIVRIDPRLLAAIETASNLIACEGLTELVERKTAGIAVHWRGREEISEDVMRKMRRIWSMVPDRTDLRFAPFNGGIEIRVANRDKGDVVRLIFNELGPRVAMAYLGDDETDEDAFGALTGRGLNILVGDKCRPSLADVWIRPPEDVVAFLRGWISACPPLSTAARI
jgi:trehalose-phosphatase